MGFLSLHLSSSSLTRPGGFLSPSPPPLFPSIGESGAFFRMGLGQSPGPLAGGSQSGAERLMAALESCQLSLMNVDFCCWPLKSVLLWSRTMQKPNRDFPPTASPLQFWELLEIYIHHANLGWSHFRKCCWCLYSIFFFFLSFSLFRATPMAYGSSQARGRIETVAAGLCHSHSNSGSSPHLRPTPQLTATPFLNPLSEARD